MNFNRSSLRAIIVIAGAAILIAVYIADPTMLSLSSIAGPMIDGGITVPTTTILENTEGTVAVGVGNLTLSINQFLPSNIEIQQGENITFYAPSGSTEIHNVIFDLTNGSALSGISVPFLLPSGVSPEALQLAAPYDLGEPVIQNITDDMQAIIGLNKVAFHPSVVNQDGEVSYLQEQEFILEIEQAIQQGLFMPALSANYTMEGTERMVSSGLILDVMGFGIIEEQEQQDRGQQEGLEGQQQQDHLLEEVGEFPLPAYPVLSNFTVTFEEPGTYQFFCAFHPGMAGVVNVSEGNTIQDQTGI